MEESEDEESGLGMPSMSDEDRNLERLVHKAARDDRLLAVVLFGSHARGQEAPGSDVDVCLVLDPHGAHDTTGEIRLEYLEATPPSFDVQVYQRLPLYVRRRILAEGKVLYCRGEDALYDLARQTIREFEDFRPRYQCYLDEVAHGGS